ncbi:hypothetical protein FC756_09620 [Lysinibacillus mangiferihumi]|uniref:Uncharacterized protein n=1 Tax=Lysinibacillus mangiferihumi TaxID=1130819 RepID=A0A4U2Z5F9_9BACI|nr:hypothetical protein [Lysinibacillus mangiferihumi]TKI69114.1 hypothetical protein FC756_09620 [Lysinibacillus mangiferihumi]
MRFAITLTIFTLFIVSIYYLLPSDKIWLMILITPISFWSIAKTVESIFCEEKVKRTKNLKDNDEALSWYLKNETILFFCIITPPIGYLIVVSNLKKFEYKQRVNYLFITTLITSIWLLKFLPGKLQLYVWSLIATILIGNLTLNIFKGKK